MYSVTSCSYKHDEATYESKMEQEHTPEVTALEENIHIETSLKLLYLHMWFSLEHGSSDYFVCPGHGIP